MNCLCCGKPLPDSAFPDTWHKSCIRSFFGTNALPELNLSNEVLLALAEKSTGQGHTVPGVQKKLSLHLSTEGRTARFTLVDYPAGYILKPQSDLYPALPEAEFLVMQMARQTGIDTVPHALVFLGEENPSAAYITRRVDRSLPEKKTGYVRRLAMEDFCQLNFRLTEDKYRGSYELCAKTILRRSDRPGLDLSELFLRLVFSFITGNSDMHLKNFSLIETGEDSRHYVLAPAYDLLPVNLIIPEDTEETALALNGKKRHLHRNDFLRFADTAGIPRGAAGKMIDRVLSLVDRYHTLCQSSFLPEPMKVRFDTLIDARQNALAGNSVPAHPAPGIAL